LKIITDKTKVDAGGGQGVCWDSVTVSQFKSNCSLDFLSSKQRDFAVSNSGAVAGLYTELQVNCFQIESMM